MDKEYIAIPQEEYADLLHDSKFLSALSAAGVDNWDGYDWALELMESMYPSELKR